MSSTWCKTCVQLVKAARLERSNATLSTYDVRLPRLSVSASCEHSGLDAADLLAGAFLLRQQEEAMRSAFDEVQEHLSHIHDQIGCDLELLL